MIVVHVTPIGHVAHVIAVLSIPPTAHVPLGHALQEIEAPATTVAKMPPMQPDAIHKIEYHIS